MREIQSIGIVKGGKFFPMDRDNPVEVNATGLVEATTLRPLDLSEHEGKVIMISGQDHPDGGPIYGAKIEDVANPILSVIVLKVFNKSGS